MNIKCFYLLLTMISFFGVAGNAIAENGLKKFDKKFKVDAQIGELSFLGDDGKVIKEYPIQKYVPKKMSPSFVSVSDNGKFVCVNTVTKEDSSGEDVKAANAVILDDKGNEIWTVQHNFSTGAYVSPNGKYILCQGDTSIRIYYSNGEKTEIKTDDSIGNDQLSFAKDGGFVVMVLTKIDVQKEKEGHKATGKWGSGVSRELVAIDENGQELWRKYDLPEGRLWIPSVKVSENNEIQVTLFSIQEKKKHFRFYSPDGNFVREN